MSYVSFHVTVRDNNGAPFTDPTALAAIKNSKQGVSRIFNKITLRSGFSVIESFVYNKEVGKFLSSANSDRRKWLRITEGLGVDNLFATGASRKFTMQICSSLFSNELAIPLPIFTGGIQVKFSIATPDEFFTTAVPRFSVDQPSLTYVAICPDPAFTLDLVRSIQSGRSAWFPLVETKTVRSPGNGTDMQTYNVAVGNYSRVESIHFTHWENGAYRLRSNDKFERYKDAGLKSWNVTDNEITNPSFNRRFTHGPRDVETFLVTHLSDTGSMFTVHDAANYPEDLANGISAFDTYRNKHFKAGLTLTSDNEVWGSGLSLVGSANPHMVIDAQYETALPNSTTTEISVNLSLLLELSGTRIDVHRVFA
ncbi:hypothetical protein HK097_000416 [Rhizophlyctis rosea]|uniref:Uncharacterized protein n=1 Tax=Rhizophlyctis rosea TaxID=64517 RepID=A0AAD5X4M4_9FUNG|nr:hypothetical protein HK097_000416 [Rhizophlyctis rosea]